MTDTPYEHFSRIFEAHAGDAEETACNRGWLSAWQKSIDPLFTDDAAWDESFWSLRDDLKLTGKKRADFITFITTHLLATDPTPEKIYAPYLFRWFRYGMAFEDLAKAAKLLSRYDADTKKGITYEMERFANPPRINRKGKQKLKPISSNPLKSSRRIHEMVDFFDTYDQRQDFLHADAARRARDQEYIESGAVVLHADTPTWRIYSLKSIDAANAYGKGVNFYLWFYDEDEPVNFVHIELPNASRYRIDPNNLRTESDRSDRINIARMLRDLPGLAEALAPAFKDLLADKRFTSEHRTGDWAFLSMASRVCDQPLFGDGYAAERFRSVYEEKIQECQKSRLISSKENTKKNAESHAYAGDLSARLAREKEHRNGLFQTASQDICVIARYSEERGKIDGHLIKQIFQMAQEEHCLGEAQKILAITSHVPAWRAEFHAPDILPLFAALAAPNGTNYSRRLNALVFLFGLAAKNTDWRDGNEAVHLPLAIETLTGKKDWAKLKTLLICAGRPNDPVSTAWREVISFEARQSIRLHRFDNAYKRHHIDVLLNRLDAIDNGDYKPYPIRDTPMGLRGQQIEEHKAEIKRTARKNRREKIVQCG